MTIVTQNPTPSRRDRKKRETRQRIVDEATRLFAERGFDAPTVDEIADAADVAKGTIYNHFGSKEELLFEFLLELEAEVQAEAARFGEAPGPLESVLESWLRYQFRLKEPHVAFVRVFLSQLVLRADAYAHPIERFQLHVDPAAATLLGRLRERGLIPPNADQERVADALKCLHFGLSTLWAMEGPPFEMAYQALATQVSAFARAVERGLR